MALADQALALCRTLGDDWTAGQVLRFKGLRARERGDYAATKAYSDEGLALSRRTGDPYFITRGLSWASMAAHLVGDQRTALALLQEALPLQERLGDRYGVAMALNNFGERHRAQGELAQAREYYERALAMARDLGARGLVCTVHANMALLNIRVGDSAAAQSAREALHLAIDLGRKQLVAGALTAFAGVAAIAGQPERAARLLGAAEAQLAAGGYQLEPTDRADFDFVAAQVRAALDEPAMAARWAEGAAFSLEHAAAYALEDTAALSVTCL